MTLDKNICPDKSPESRVCKILAYFGNLAMTMTTSHHPNYRKELNNVTRIIWTHQVDMKKKLHPIEKLTSKPNQKSHPT